MISAFGAVAEAYARTLPPALEAVITQPDGVGGAYRAAVARRAQGRPFYAMLLIDDPRVEFTYGCCDAVRMRLQDRDAHIYALDQLTNGTMQVNGRPAAERWEFDPTLRLIAAEFFVLADAVLVRSFAEFSRFGKIFALLPRPMERIVGDGRNVPIVPRRRPARPQVVVWSPRTSSVMLAFHAIALRELRADVIFVSSDGAPLPACDARFARRDDPAVAEALAVAACVVAADISDPQDAVAFARQGFGVVAPMCAGAHELAENVTTFEGTHARALFAAASVGLTRPASVRMEPAAPPTAPSWPRLPPDVEAPLVSVVIPTYNRRRELGEILERLQGQTYPRFEVVVVNDAGADVADVVAPHAFARLITLPENRGPHGAIVAGTAEIRGEVVQYVADDDVLFPDHLERLVAAMLRSGASVAHASALLTFGQRGDDGVWRETGHNASTFYGTAMPMEALVGTPIAGHAYLMRRDVADVVGGVSDSMLADQEYQARLSTRFVMVYVDAVTCEVRAHEGNWGQTKDGLSGVREMFAAHPIEGRPIVQQMRDGLIANVAARTKGIYPFPRSIGFAPDVAEISPAR